MNTTLKASTSLFAMLAMTAGLVGCGNTVANNRAETKSTDTQDVKSEAANAPEDFPIGDDMNLTDVQLANVKERIRYINYVNVVKIAPLVNEARAWCSAVVFRYKTVLSDIATANVQTVILEGDRVALDKSIAKEEAERNAKLSLLSQLKGELSVLSLAVLKFGPKLRTEIALASRETANQIKLLEQSLVEIRKNMDSVLNAPDFDEVRYEALHDMADKYEADIADLREALDRQIKLLRKNAPDLLTDLVKARDAARAELSAKSPGLLASIADDNRSLAKLRATKAAKIREINNNAASKLSLPVVDPSCAMLGIK